MSGATRIGARVKCFRSEWVEVGGVRLLLYRLLGETSVDLDALLREAPDLGNSWDTLVSERLGSYLRKTLPGILGGCSLYYVELSRGGTQLGYAYVTERLKCVPVSAYPDAVLSVEILSKPQAGDVEELDFVQRGVLTSRRVPLSEDLYAVCLVGEVVGVDTAAVGLEIASGGLKVLLVDELRSTALVEVTAGQARRRARKRRRRSRRRGASKK